MGALDLSNSDPDSVTTEWHTLTVERDGEGYLYRIDHPDTCPPASDDPDVLFAYRCLTDTEFFEGDYPNSDDEHVRAPGVYRVRGRALRSGYYEPEWEQWLEWGDEVPTLNEAESGSA